MADLQQKKETAKAKPTDAEAAGLHGSVKQVREACYKAVKKDGDILPGKELFQRANTKNGCTTYDEKGAKTEDKVFREDGGYYLHRYNAFGKASEWFSYRKDGKLESKGVARFDEKGNQLETVSWNHEGKIMVKTTYSYDDKGNMLSQQNYNAAGKSDSECVMKYNEKGYRIESKTVHENGSIAHWNTYKHDEKGNVIEMNWLNADGTVERTSTFTYEYDSEGNLIKENIYWLRRRAKKFEEELCNDEHGNWVEKTEMWNGIPTYITLRKISYYGDPESGDAGDFDKPLINLTAMENNNEKKQGGEGAAPVETASSPEKQAATQVQWVAEGSSSENFSAMRYYVSQNNELPSDIIYTASNVEVMALKKECEANLGAKVIHTHSIKQGELNVRPVRYTLGFPHSGYLLQAMQIQSLDFDQYVVPDFMDEYNELDEAHTSQLVLLHPSDGSGKRDLDFEAELEELMEKCTLEKLPDMPEINMIKVADNSFSIEAHAVDDDFEIRNLEIHYGYGFEKFHSELMSRFKNETKGLILFHGEPGTGKTYYIRHLLRKMASQGKIVIYMPPNMVDYLTDPAFMTFLSREVADFSNQGYFCVLLIEDAEPLLIARHENARAQGITNLLNMTDGLLNDFLNLQIICTFNVPLKELDKALLRPGRLIARKEFKPLPALDANRLAQQLGIKHHFSKSATLSEIYAMLKNKNTLVHELEDEEEEIE